MARVEFDVQIEMPMMGFCVVVGANEDGEQIQHLSTFGDPRLWTLIGLADCAVDEFREQYREQIRNAEEE